MPKICEFENCKNRAYYGTEIIYNVMCKQDKKKICNPSISTRLFTLKEEFDKQIKHIKNEENNDLLEIKYLYFDNFN